LMPDTDMTGSRTPHHPVHELAFGGCVTYFEVLSRIGQLWQCMMVRLHHRIRELGGSV